MPNTGKIATLFGLSLTDSDMDISTKADLVNGLVPASQLPSYVDDVLEYANLAALPVTGETGKIYVTLDANKIYRWSGSTYIEVSPTVGGTWGAITGTLTNQTDLQAALDTKVPTARTLTINGTTYDLSANRSWTIAADSTARTVLAFTATASQTTFTVTNGYTPGMLDVYINGIKLAAAEYTASDGTTVVLATGTGLNNVVEIVKYNQALTMSNALRTVTKFTATAAQTVFTVAYNAGLVDVFYNGSKLDSSEYTATNGTSITLTVAAALNDVVEVIAYSYAVGGFSGQAQLNGTGFVKVSGTTVSYDNSTYLTTASAASTYQPIITNNITGTGTANYHAKFTAGGVLGIGLIYDTGINILINTTTDNGLGDKLQVSGGRSYFQGGLATNSTVTYSTGANINPGVYISRGSSTGNFNGIVFQGAYATDMYLGMTGLSGNDNLYLRNNSNQNIFTFSTAGNFTALGTIAGTSATFSGSVQATSMSIGIAPQTDKMFVYNASGTNTGLTIQQDGTGDIFRANGNSGANRFVITQAGAATFSASVNAVDYFASNRVYVKGTGTLEIGLTGNDTYIQSYVTSTAGNNNMLFYTGTTERMRITAGGYVAINSTTAPQGQMYINGGSNSDILALQNTLNTGAYLVFADNVTPTWPNAPRLGAISNDMVFKTLATERMRITSTGSVLVGMTSGVSGRITVIGLQVQNEVYSRGTSSGFFWEDRTLTTSWGGWYTNNGLTYMYNGSGNASSINMSTGVYTALSDITKKKDFEQSTIGLDAVLALKPMLYRMKTDTVFAPKQLGFIAQEVKDIIPQAYVETDDFIGLNDRPIVAALVKAVQELKAENDLLKDRLDRNNVN